MTASPKSDLLAVATAFHEWFRDYEPWDIDVYQIPDQALVQRLPGHISGEWSVRWIFGTEDGEEYLEFYARHRMTSDRHERLYASGRVEHLPASVGHGMLAPLRSAEDDRRLRDDLRRKGLL